MVDPNTRQGKRTPVTLKIKFKSETLEQFIERYAVDVSQGGIFIRTKEPLAVGTQMKFEFQLRDASPLIAGEGTVVWTRENDPSRPAIAPGMGVRFDRLNEGSQAVLERILAEKAKQAPQRPDNATTKPPLFTDTPTRVAPAPVQDALLGQESAASQKPRKRPDSFNEQTPLPKPMPFHSDADEFPDEAFEEATKVRALDELIAQTAEGSTNGLPAAGLRNDTLQDARAMSRAETATRDSAPGLPSPPEPAMRAQGRLLDTSPSPRTEAGSTLQMGSNVASLPEAMARTRLGVEPAPAVAGRARVSTPPANVAIKEAPPQVRAVASEPSPSARMPASGKNNNAAIVIISLLVVAAAGAAVWFFVLKPQEEERIGKGSGSQVVTPGSGSGSVGSAGSQAMVTPGSGSNPGSAVEAPPKGPIVETVISASEKTATVEIEGTDQSGPAPFTAKLEKDKAYKAKIRAPGFVAFELDVKGGDKPAPAKLAPKPRVITVTSDPPGAMIYVDDKSSTHSTPFDVELTAPQAAKKSVRVGLRKGGYRYVEKLVDLSKLTEDDTRLVGKVDEKLAVQVVVHNPNPPNGSGSGSGKGSNTGSGSDSGPVTSPNGSGDGSAASGSATPNPGSGAGSAKGSAEPEPDFNKQP